MRGCYCYNPCSFRTSQVGKLVNVVNNTNQPQTVMYGDETCGSLGCGSLRLQPGASDFAFFDGRNQWLGLEQPILGGTCKFPITNQSNVPVSDLNNYCLI